MADDILSRAKAWQEKQAQDPAELLKRARAWAQTGNINVPAGSDPNIPSIDQSWQKPWGQEVSWPERVAARNLGSTEEEKAQYITNRHPELQTKVYGDQTLYKKPDEQAWHPLNPKGADLSDVTDLPFVADLIGGMVQGAATAPFALSGNIPAASAVSAGTGAGIEALKQGLAKAIGVNSNWHPGDIGMQGGIGAVVPVIGEVAGSAYKNIVKPAIREASTTLLGAMPGVNKEMLKTYLEKQPIIDQWLSPAYAKMKLALGLKTRDEAKNLVDELGAKTGQEEALAAANQTPINTDPMMDETGKYIKEFAQNNEGTGVLSPEDQASIASKSKRMFTSSPDFDQNQSMFAFGPEPENVNQKTAADLFKALQEIENNTNVASKGVFPGQESDEVNFLKRLSGKTRDQIAASNPNWDAARSAYREYLTDASHPLRQLQSPATVEQFVSSLGGPNKEFARQTAEKYLPETYPELNDYMQAQKWTKKGPSGSDEGMMTALRNAGVNMMGLGAAAGNPELATAGGALATTAGKNTIRALLRGGIKADQMLNSTPVKTAWQGSPQLWQELIKQGDQSEKK